jgi:hypothetical protein
MNSLFVYYIIVTSISLLLVSFSLEETDERFYHTFVMLDHPGADINDTKNLYLSYYFVSSDIAEPGRLLDAARAFCYHADNTRFLSLWSEEAPCEVAIALSALYEMTTAVGKYSGDIQIIAKKTLLAMNRDKSYRINQFQSNAEVVGNDSKNISEESTSKIRFLAIILPVTSKGSNVSHFSDISNLPLFQYFVTSLVNIHRKLSVVESIPVYVFIGNS